MKLNDCKTASDDGGGEMAPAHSITNERRSFTFSVFSLIYLFIYLWFSLCEHISNSGSAQVVQDVESSGAKSTDWGGESAKE